MQLLEGIRVLDMTQIMAGPYATMILGDLGAEVLKVEKPNGGDDTRNSGPHVNGESVSFFQINRNKKSVVIDLKNNEGKNLFYELIKTSDIIVENYRPGVTENLGVDYSTVKKINPGIVYCSISGFGQTGPYSNKGGFDLVAQAMSGIMSMTGEPNGKPLKTGVAVYDIGAGITAVYSILAAYIYKLQTGEGQQVDVSLAEVGLPWFAWEAAAYFTNGNIPEPTGWRHRSSAPYQVVKTSDGYIMLGCANQRTWERFCEGVVEKPEWIQEERFKTNSDRIKNVESLEKMIEDVLETQDSSYWLNKCEKAGVPVGPINNFEEAVQDPHYLDRDMIKEVDHPVIGKMKTIGIPTKFSKTPGAIRMPSPILGQHTNEVLSSIGIPNEKLSQLRKKGTIK